MKKTLPLAPWDHEVNPFNEVLEPRVWVDPLDPPLGSHSLEHLHSLERLSSPRYLSVSIFDTNFNTSLFHWIDLSTRQELSSHRMVQTWRSWRPAPGAFQLATLRNVVTAPHQGSYTAIPIWPRWLRARSRVASSTNCLTRVEEYLGGWMANSGFDRARDRGVGEASANRSKSSGCFRMGEALGHASRIRSSARLLLRNAEELAPAGDSEQTDVIRLSVID